MILNIIIVTNNVYNDTDMMMNHIKMDFVEFGNDLY